MFTTPCFIKKNTKGLRNRLEGIGYLCGDPDIEGIIESYSSLFTIIDSHTYFGSDRPCVKHFIDCGTNEELFLAIAALRDDSDINQWFICDQGVMGYGEDGFPKWLDFEGDCKFCDSDEFYAPVNPYRWHKATVEELIEHFKEE